MAMYDETRDLSRRSSSSEGRRIQRVVAQIDATSENAVFFVDEGSSSSVRGSADASPLPYHHARAVPVVFVSGEDTENGSLEDIAFARHISRYRRQGGSRRSQYSYTSEQSSDSNLPRSGSQGDCRHVRRHSERSAKPRRKASVRRSVSEVKSGEKRRVRSRTDSAIPSRPLELTAEEAQKERRRRKIVFIIVATFMLLVFASVLIVVVTLTHSSFRNVENTTMHVYTFSQNPNPRVI